MLKNLQRITKNNNWPKTGEKVAQVAINGQEKSEQL